MPHIHEKIDFAADVFIVNEGAVLLRMHDKHKMWLAPGGHIELDEDPEEAALREVAEEVGIPITLVGDAPDTGEDNEKELRKPEFVNRHFVNETHEHISFVYFATSQTRETHPQEGETTDGFKWFTKEELDDASYGVKPRVRHYAKAALNAAH